VADLQVGSFAFRWRRITSLKAGHYNGRWDYQPEGWPLQNRTTGTRDFGCSGRVMTGSYG
jgi:hypothetical protein